MARVYNVFTGKLDWTATWGWTWDVVWPASATDSHLAAFDTTTGKLIKDSGYSAADFTNALSGQLHLDQSTPQTVTGRQIQQDGIQFWITPTVWAFAEGKMYYDTNYKTMAAQIDTDVTLQIGQEDHIYCKNGSASPMVNWHAVYFYWANSGLPDIRLAKADTFATSVVFGICTQNIANWANWLITRRWEIHDIDTTGAPYWETWNAWDVLYLSTTTAWALTNVIPTGTNIESRVGRVLEVHATAWEIYVDLFRTYRLTDLADVTTTTPAVDQVLKFNWLERVNGSPASWWAWPWIEFYNCTPVIRTRTAPAWLSQDGTAGNGIRWASLSKTPVTTAEQTQTWINNWDTRPFASWLYDTALNRTTVDAGTWEFTTYASISSTANTPQLIRAVYQVVPWTGTLAFSGAWANTRTATITWGTPFQWTYYAASATNTVASWIQATSGTDKGMYQITATTSTSVATCTVRTGYANETGVSYNVWNLLFVSNTPLTSTAVTTYNTSIVQPAFTVAATDKLWGLMFITSTANAKTVTIYYNGNLRNTHFSTPLITMHNNLAGLQWGTSNEYYHITSAEKTVVSNTSWTNTWDNSANTNANTYADWKVSDTAYDATSWDWVTTIAPSKNAVRDKIETLAPLASPTFTGTVTLPTVQLGEVSIKLDQTLSADWTWCWTTVAGTGWETLAFGDLCYFKATDSKRYKVDWILDWTDTWFSKRLGFCVLAWASTTTEILLDWKIRADAKFPTLTIGAAVYASDTAWEIVVTQPSTTNFAIRVVGYWITADELQVDISPDYMVHI